MNVCTAATENEPRHPPTQLHSTAQGYRIVRLLAVSFQSVEGVSKTRKQARRDWSEQTSQGETGGEAPLPQHPLGSHVFGSLS